MNVASSAAAAALRLLNQDAARRANNINKYESIVNRTDLDGKMTHQVQFLTRSILRLEIRQCCK